MKRWVRRLAKLFGALVILSTLSFIIWLSQSTVILTEGNVYHRIALPIFGGRSIAWRANFSAIADTPNIQDLQGPVVWISNDEYRAEWVCGTGVKAERVKKNTAFTIPCGDKRHSYTIFDTPADGVSTIIETNGLIAVTSDLEGNIDDTNAWSFSNGHLVIAGDILDRGRYVYDMLWYFYSLEQQAKNAGGGLHILIGNHEQYGFQGRIKSVETEHFWAIEQIAQYDEALSEKTILGNWLRSKPILVKINDILFTHGGISPSVLDTGLSLDELNAQHYQALARNPSQDTKSLIYGALSPTQYRGYSLATDKYDIATNSLVEKTKAHFDVNYIVVGHNKVDSLEPRYNNSVFVVENTNTSPETLFFRNGKPEIRTSSILKTEYEDINMSSRSFELTNLNDWRAFFGVLAMAKRTPK